MSKTRIHLFHLISIAVAIVMLLPMAITAQEVKRGGTVIVGISDNPSYLIPNVSYTIGNLVVSNSMFEGLVNYDMKGNLVPELASSWNFSPDGKTWTFNLQKGVKWHDGKDFTSADVAFSIKEVAEKYHPLGKQAFGPISKIDTPDPHTVVFRFDKPFSPTVNYLSCWFAGILPKHLYENTDILKNPNNLKPVGTGPFKFEEFKTSDHLTVVRNPNYWRKGKPYLDRVVFRVILDGAARILAMEKGEIDVLPPYSMPISEMTRLKEKGSNTVAFQTPAASMNLVLMNLNNKYLADRKVRYAIAHAINRQEVITKAYFGYGKVPVGPIPSSMPWAFTDDVPKFDYNPARANQLLDEAGYKKGSDGMRFQIDFVYVGSYTEFDRTAKIMQAQMREVGIDLRLKPIEQAAGIDEIYKKKNFGFTYWSLTMGPDPAVGTARLYHSDQIRATAGITNAMSYSNPDVDRLFAEGGSSTSMKAAGEKYRQIQKLIVQDMPCLWIAEPFYVMSYSSKLEGLPAGPFWTEHMENVGWKK
jgi:peptide/nickel transport system substrate-binding protein